MGLSDMATIYPAMYIIFLARHDSQIELACKIFLCAVQDNL